MTFMTANMFSYSPNVCSVVTSIIIHCLRHSNLGACLRQLLITLVRQLLITLVTVPYINI